MVTRTDLRRLLNIKRIFLFLALNAVNDIISVSAVWNRKEQVLSNAEIYSVFDRYFCTEISLLSYILYISLYSFVLFLSIHRIAEDNQKYGVFYLVRLRRPRYALGKLISSVLFAFLTAFTAVFQSFLCHKISNISISLAEYGIVLLLSFGIFLSCMEIGILSYSLFKSTNFSFLVGIAFLTALSLIFSQKNLCIPSPKQIPTPYFYPLALAVLLLLPIYLIFQKMDFMTTKIKE